MTDGVPHDIPLEVAGSPPEPSPDPRPRLDCILLCDRAAYEARHGTLDGPPETHRWDADPF